MAPLRLSGITQAKAQISQIDLNPHRAIGGEKKHGGTNKLFLLGCCLFGVWFAEFGNNIN